MGLDFGTTSVSAAAVAEDGRLVARGTRSHRADIAGLRTGRAEQSPVALLETGIELLREVMAGLSESPTCLGLTGQMHGLLLADDRLRPVGNLVTWQDKRSLEAHGAGGTALARFRVACDPATVARTGCMPSPGYLAVTLFAMHSDLRSATEARHALIFADWAAATLTGAEPVTDRTNAASTGVFDLERDEWSELIDATGLPREMFPRVVESGTIVGGLARPFAERTGLPEGLPVASAIGDHQAAVLGSLPAGENAVHVNIGTGGQVSLPVGRFLRTPTSDTRYLPDGRYLLVGAGMAGGDSYAWVRRTIGNWLAAFGVERSDDELFETLNRLGAAAPPGCDELRCEPFFRGTRREPERRGGFAGVSEGNFTPGHVARAVLEGIGEALAVFVREHSSSASDATQSVAPVESHAERGTQIDVGGDEGRRLLGFSRVIATGNAVRRNRLLAVSLARAFGLPVFVTEHEEEAAYGAAVLAGVRAGIWSDLTAAGHRFRLIQAAGPDDTD